MDYYLELDGQTKGPYQSHEIQSMIANGTLGFSNLIWNENYADWKKISETEFAVNNRPPNFSTSETSSSNKILIPFQAWDDELVISKTLSNTTILTTHRIYNREVTLSSEFNNTIYLENISSVEYGSKSKLWLFILALFTIIGGMYSIVSFNNHNFSLISIVIAIFLFIAWGVFRKKALIITPNGGNPIKIMLEGLSGAELNDLIEKIHQARFERVRKLYR